KSAAARRFDDDNIARRDIDFVATLERNQGSVMADDAVAPFCARTASGKSERLGLAPGREDGGRHRFQEADAPRRAVAASVGAPSAGAGANGEGLDQDGIARFQ